VLRLNAHALRGYKKIKQFASIVYLFPRIFTIATLLILVLLFGRVVTFPFISFSFGLYATMLVSIIFIFFTFRVESSKRKKDEESPTIRSILKVSLPMLVTHSSFLILNWMNILLIGYFSTEVDAGIYNVALRVAMMTSLTLQAVNSIAAPKFAENYSRQDKNGLNKVINQSTKLILYSSTPILLGCVIFSRPILSIFGPAFKDGYLVLIIIAIGQFFSALCGPVGNILNMTGHERIVKNTMSSALIINLILGIIFIPGLGILGAAVSITVTTIYWNAILVIAVKKKIGVSMFRVLFKKFGIQND
jgi:O-antigen/teichoic acid export membrane protein